MDSLEMALHVCKLASYRYLRVSWIFLQERDLLCGSLHMWGEVCSYGPSKVLGQCGGQGSPRNTPERLTGNLENPGKTKKAFLFFCW